MALSDKNIIITPNIGLATDPKIVFSGADATTSPQNVTMQVYPASNGTLSIDGSIGQLFSVTSSMTGTIFSVNDISGIPSIEVLDTGLVKIAQYNGNVTIGSTSSTTTLNGSVNAVNDATINGVRVGKGNSAIATNTAVGVSALNANTTGSRNTAVGSNALLATQGGVNNTAIGASALAANTSGDGNNAFGDLALNANTSGPNNTALGRSALLSNTVGANNVASGNFALNANTASDNVGTGYGALLSKVGGNGNTAIGFQAGRYSGATGTTALTSATNSIYIGQDSRGAAATGDSNSIVIGSSAVGLGANTTVIGNSSTTATKIFGALSVGADLTATSTTNIATGATVSGATNTINVGTGGVTGSTTSIAIGSTAGTSTTTLNGVVNLSARTASQAVFTDANKNLVSVETTGTGSAVLAVSPTITGTLAAPILTTTGDITVKSGSTTGSATITTPTTELVLSQTGDQFGASTLRLQNRNGVNGAMFDCSAAVYPLVDFVFKTANATRNIRLETRGGGLTFTGGDGYEFQIGNFSGDNPSLAIGNTQMFIRATTASTSTTTGALRVAGGAGIAGNLNVGGNAVITGNLTVNGTTTTVNSVTLTVNDKNIELGSVGTPTNTTADGGGITLKAGTDVDKTLNWVNATSAWTSSEDFNLLTGKVYKINGTSVLSATTLGSGVTASSLTSLGTITSLSAGTGTFTPNTSGVSTGLNVVNGDITTYRAGGTTGVIYLTNSGTKYLYFDGTNYVLNGAPVVASNITAAGNVTGSAATLTTARTINGVSFNGSANITLPTIVTTSETAPASPTAGALWWDSSSGALKIYYTDADSSQWVDAFVSAGGGATTTEIVYAVTGTTPAISPSNGGIQTWTLTANSTPTAGTWAAGQSLTLMVNDTASVFTVTWTTLGVVWVGGSAPTLLPGAGYTVIELWKVGSTIYGALVGQVA